MTECAVREVLEETGLQIRITGLIGTYTDPHVLIAYSDGEVRREFSFVYAAAIQPQISNALTEKANGHSRYTVTVDVIEHRLFFTLGNWNAPTRLKWRVQQGNGSILREGVSVGEGHRSNMAGYLYSSY